MKSNNLAITGFCFACKVVSFVLISLFLFAAVFNFFLSNVSSSNSSSSSSSSSSSNSCRSS